MKPRYYSLITFVTILMLSSCVNTKFLKEDQYLLTGQKITGNETVNTSELENLYRQEANTKILGMMPKLFFYQLGQNFYDSVKVANKIEKVKQKYNPQLEKLDPNSNKAYRLERKRDRKLEKLNTQLEEGNWLMRKLGEPPVIFDSTLAGTTAEQMHLYVFNQGFFDNKVNYTTDTNKRQINVTYHIKEFEPYILSNVEYMTNDTNIRELINKNQEDAIIKRSDRYQESKFTEERERLDKLLRNNGYYGFSREYVSFTNDTSATDSILGDKVIDTRVIIKSPVDGEHKLYRFDEVYFVLDATSNTTNQSGTGKRDTVSLNGINYLVFKKHHPYAILDRKLQFKQGELYNQVDITNTQAQLNSMDMFRFVNLTFDTTDSRLVSHIYTSPLPKYQITDEVGIIVSQGAPGPYLNATFKVRNMFNRYEIFELSGRYSEEGQLNPFQSGSVYRARELSLNASVLFPEFLLPNPWKAPFVRYNPKTRFLMGYTDINRPEYHRSIARSSLSYLMQLGAYKTLSISPIDLSLVNTERLDSLFKNNLDELAEKGNNIRASFNRSIVSSISSYFVYNTSQAADALANSRFFRAAFEIGGLTPNLLSIAIDEGGDKIRGLTYFQYTRTDLDYRYYLPINPSSTIATRVRTGLAIPIGKSTTIPYEKFFFAGGGNSIRAWRPRRLGPGSYENINAETGLEYGIEQPGEFIIETSVEWRRKLISFLEGALFIDAGNVWSFRDDRLGGKFQFNQFYKEIAVGTGVGARLDFSFLIVRFDLGIKVYDPMRVNDEFRLDNLKFTKEALRKDTALQIGIGYPF